MRAPSIFRTISLLALAVSVPAAAQMADAPAAKSCDAPADLPDAMTSWRSPVMAKIGADVSNGPMLIAGQAVTITLLPTPDVRYPVRPAKPGGSVSYGGVARFIVDKAGTWRVALGSGAWVDVIKGKTAMTSVAHGHGPDCSGIRKMVDYDLKPGSYVLQVAANGTDSLPLLVTRLP